VEVGPEHKQYRIHKADFTSLRILPQSSQWVLAGS
jgi:hypothetical protein